MADVKTYTQTSNQPGASKSHSEQDTNAWGVNVDVSIRDLPLGWDTNPAAFNRLTARAKGLTKGQLLQLAFRIGTAALDGLTWEDIRSIEEAFDLLRGTNFNANGDPMANSCCCCPPCCCCC